MIDLNKIYTEDCLETMARMTDNFVDLVITSPPYNIGKNYVGHLDNLDNYLEWLTIRLKEAIRVSQATWINLGYRKLNNGNIPIAFQVFQDLLDTGAYLMQHIVWEYGAGMTYKKRFNHRKEDWLWFVKNPKSYTFNPNLVREAELTKYKNDKRNNPSGKLPSDVWYFPHIAGNFRERKNHPAMFPEKMIKRIALATSNKGDVIYDPFAGSGTTGIVAKRLNRNFILSEISSEYCDIIKERFRLEFGDEL